MSRTESVDPYILPRPYPMVVRLLKHRTGISITPARARQLEVSALKKLAKAIEPPACAGGK